MEKLKGDFESLSIAIANLPVGLIPFPDRCALLSSVLSLPSQLFNEMVHTCHKDTPMEGLPGMLKYHQPQKPLCVRIQTRLHPHCRPWRKAYGRLKAQELSRCCHM